MKQDGGGGAATGTPSRAYVALLEAPMSGPFVVLEPMRRAHAPALLAAASDPSIWAFSIAQPLITVLDARDFVADALRNRRDAREVPFVIVHKTDRRVIGTTRFMQLEPEYAALEIGMTWLDGRYHGTGCNTAAKLLLLERAFDVAGAIRVEFQADTRNARSRSALKKIGATYEGTLRRYHAHARNGYARDTAVYSVIDRDWPAVSSRLRSLAASEAAVVR
jgi:RimJ/RimL family protein N-acetyltransferase